MFTSIANNGKKNDPNEMLADACVFCDASEIIQPSTKSGDWFTSKRRAIGEFPPFGLTKLARGGLYQLLLLRLFPMKMMQRDY